MYTGITGIILAGGSSSRSRVNKAFLKIGEYKIIEIIKNVLIEIFEEVILIANKQEEYGFLGLKTFKDIYTEKGPLAGIHSGLTNSKTEKNFFIPCDIPFMNKDTIEYLIENEKGTPITIFKTIDGIQPLCGIYSKQCIYKIEEILTNEINQNYSIHNLLDKTETKIIDIEKEYKGFNPKSFFNINTIEDYEAIKNII